MSDMHDMHMQDLIWWMCVLCALDKHCSSCAPAISICWPWPSLSLVCCIVTISELPTGPRHADSFCVLHCMACSAAAWPPPQPAACSRPLMPRALHAVTPAYATHLAGTWRPALVVQVLTDATLSGTGTRTRHTMSLTFSSPWSQTTTTTATPLPRRSTHHQRRSRHRVPSRRGSFRRSACFGGQFGRVGVMAYAWEE
jgi:hypothetical protein